MNQPTLSGVIKIANIRLKILTMTLSTQIPIPAALSQIYRTCPGSKTFSFGGKQQRVQQRKKRRIEKFWMSRECRCLFFLAIYYYTTVCAQGCFLLLCELKSISVMFARNGHSEVPCVLPQILDHFQNYQQKLCCS